MRSVRKSFAARLLRSLVDPSTSPLTPNPSSARDLLALARHNWILAFDHVASLTPPLAAALCRLSSGAGIAWRESGHREAVQLFLKRPILLTAAPDFPRRRARLGLGRRTRPRLHRQRDDPRLRPAGP